MIVSGIQVQETGILEQTAHKFGFQCQGKKTGPKWACMIFLIKNHKELINGGV